MLLQQYKRQVSSVPSQRKNLNELSSNKHPQYAKADGDRFIPLKKGSRSHSILSSTRTQPYDTIKKGDVCLGSSELLHRPRGNYRRESPR